MKKTEQDLATLPVNCAMLATAAAKLNSTARSAMFAGFYGEVTVEIKIQDGKAWMIVEHLQRTTKSEDQ